VVWNASPTLGFSADPVVVVTFAELVSENSIPYRYLVRISCNGFCILVIQTTYMKDSTDRTESLFEGFPRPGNTFRKMVSTPAFLKGYLPYRGGKTRRHRTMERRIQYKRKVWEVMSGPNTFT
jgi:hypothetical protein